jgi:hypothetical protein
MNESFYVEAQVTVVVCANIRIYGWTRVQSDSPPHAVGIRNHDSLCDVVASD